MTRHDEQPDQGNTTPEAASASGESGDPGLVEAVVERSRRAAAEAHPDASMADPTGDGRAEIMIPGADSGRQATEIVSEGKETNPGVSTCERLAELIRAGNPRHRLTEGEETALADAIIAAGWRPLPAETGDAKADLVELLNVSHDQAQGWYYWNFGHGADTILAAGWLPPSGPLPEWCCPSCGETTRARLADKIPPQTNSETERPRRCPARIPEGNVITEGRQCQQYEGHAHDHTWYGDNSSAYSAWARAEREGDDQAACGRPDDACGQLGGSARCGGCRA